MTTSAGGVPIPLTRSPRSRAAITLAVGLAAIAAGSVALFHVLPAPRSAVGDAPASQAATTLSPASTVTAANIVPPEPTPHVIAVPASSATTPTARAASTEGVMVLTPELAATAAPTAPRGPRASGGKAPARGRVDDDDQIQ